MVCMRFSMFSYLLQMKFGYPQLPASRTRSSRFSEFWKKLPIKMLWIQGPWRLLCIWGVLPALLVSPIGTDLRNGLIQTGCTNWLPKLHGSSWVHVLVPCLIQLALLRFVDPRVSELATVAATPTRAAWFASQLAARVDVSLQFWNMYSV